MDERKRNILLIVISSLVMVVFVYLEFINTESNLNSHGGFVNPLELDSTASKKDIYDEQRRRERKEFSLDRKVGSLEHFLENQVEKDPFADGWIEVIEEIGDNEGTTKGTETAQTAQSIKNELIVEGTDEVRRSNMGNGESAENEKGEQPPESPLFNGDFSGSKQRKVGFASGGNEVLTADNAEETQSEKVNVLAVVHEESQLKHGSTIRLRILESFSVGGYVIPKNTFVIGKVSFSEEHLFIDVNYISVNGRLLTTDLTAHDLNGAEGILVMGGEGKDMQGEVLEQTVSEVQKNIDVPILKSVPFTSTNKKNKEDMVLIKAGYKVYLKKKNPPPAPPH